MYFSLLINASDMQKLYTIYFTRGASSTILSQLIILLPWPVFTVCSLCDGLCFFYWFKLWVEHSFQYAVTIFSFFFAFHGLFLKLSFACPKKIPATKRRRRKTDHINRPKKIDIFVVVF